MKCLCCHMGLSGREKVMIELFSGSGEVSSSFRGIGYSTVEVDTRKRAGVCVPDLRVDVREIESLNCGCVDGLVVWASVPCDIWSYASGGHHLTKLFKPKTKKALDLLDVTDHTLSLIENCPGITYFVENPRGHLRFYPAMLDFLKKTDGHIHYITLDVFGFPTTKPTNIFSNYPGLMFPPPSNYGRGNKCQALFCNMTKSQRQKTPKLLAVFISSLFQDKPCI